MSQRSNRAALFVTSALLLSLLPTIAPAKTIYVDDDATGANNGTSWSDAYDDLQDALTDASKAPKPIEIHVAQGIYKPDQGLSQTAGDREATFQLINGVTLRGGYAGSGAPDPDARDVALYETILSGDLDGNDADTDVRSLYWEPTRRDNSHHVFTCRAEVEQDTDEPILLGGFTISGGTGGSGSFDEAGGITALRASLTITDCTFANCSGLYGGALCSNQSNITIINCSFENNLAFTGAGIYSAESELSIKQSTFRDNFQTVAPWYPAIDVYWAPGGGGMRAVDSKLRLAECELIGNRAEQGGAVSSANCDLVLLNCLLAGNFASAEPFAHPSFGGAIRHGGNPANLTNCTLTGNSARDASVIFGDSVMNNCIIWDNTTPQVSGEAVMTYSNVQGGFVGEGNKDTDPLFAELGYWADADDPNADTEPNDPNARWIDGDYHLKSEVGRWDPVSGSWVKDDATSPCIDAGDPNSDLGDEVWPDGGRLNMGAYGGTWEASMSAEPQAMFLPRVAYVHHSNVEVAEGHRALLTAYGCPTTLVPWQEVATIAFGAYDLIMVGADTGFANAWVYEQNVAAVEGSGKPVVGLGEGGYRYLGKLGLSIGQPNGAHDNGSAIEPVDPNHPLFSEPYPIEIPQDGVLELCTETNEIIIYLWPAAPDTVTTLGMDAGNAGYYPLVLEHDRYLFWGFNTTAESLTEAGRKLLVNAVIRTANAAWALQAN